MLDRMSDMDFVKWQIAYDLDPWGPERADLRSGMICHVIDAFTPGKGKPKPPSHYMPSFGGKPKQQAPVQSDAEMKANFHAFKKATEAMRAKMKGNQ